MADENEHRRNMKILDSILTVMIVAEALSSALAESEKENFKDFSSVREKWYLLDFAIKEVNEARKKTNT